MTNMPERVRLDPDHDGWEDQVVGWAADRTDDQGRPHAPEDWPVYTREEAAQAQEAHEARLAAEAEVERLTREVEIHKANAAHNYALYIDAERTGFNAGIEAAATKATSFLVGDPAAGIPLTSPTPHQIADAIRAMRKEPE